jgi:hypothetical protein
MQEISVTQVECNDKDAKSDQHTADLRALDARLSEVAADTTALAAAQRQHTEELKRASLLPAKARRQAEAAATARTQVGAAADAAARELAEHEVAEARIADALRRLEEEHTLVVTAAQRAGHATASRERVIDDLQSDYATRQLEAEAILADQV